MNSSDILRKSVNIICILTIIGSIFAKDNLCIGDSNMPRWYMLILGLCILVMINSSACLIRRENVLQTIQKPIGFWIVVACFLQSVLFFLQTLGIVAKDNFFSAGSFDNNSGLAACLTISIPVGIGKFSTYTRKQKMVFVVLKAMVLIVLFLIKSRLGIICMVTTLLLMKKNNRTMICSLLFVSVLIVTFLFKTDSSKGRLFIYERTVEMIVRHPLTGWGYKGFEKNYMTQQAYYFSNNKKSLYADLADNIHHPLCEVLQIVVDGGLVGLSFFGFVLFVIYRNVRRLEDNGETEACILVVFVYSMFSYPLHFPFTWIVVAYALSPTIKNNKCRVCVSVFSLVVAFAMLACTIKVWRADYRWWSLARKSYFAVRAKDLQEYEALFSEKCSSPYFLFNYSVALYKVGNYGKAYDIARRCFDIFNDYEVCLHIGEICERLGNYSESLSWYRLANNMIPNRITPLYRVFCVYRELNNAYMARELAKEIISFKAKVTSYTVEEIKYDAILYQKQFQK